MFTDDFVNKVISYNKDTAKDILKLFSYYINQYTTPKLPYFTSLITTPTRKRRIDKLVFPMCYKLSSSRYILIPAGMKTDYASVPRVFWVLLPPRGNWSEAAVLHDYIYKCNGSIVLYSKENKCYNKLGYWLIDRHECDKIFYKALRELNVNVVVATVFYLAVRCFGFIAWLKHKKVNYDKQYNLYFPQVVYAI